MKNNYCNNCGRTGHIYNKCNKPIISLGIIVFRKMLNTIQYLMICRKDSLGYVEFMRGKYPIHDKVYIQTIIDEMTIIEKNKILTYTFKDLWTELWGDYTGSQYKNEEKRSLEKFKKIKEGISFYDGSTCNLDYFIKTSKTKWEFPEWGFPKGRRNYLENDLTCALREFNEETGYNKRDINIIKNILAYEEIFTGSNLKSYKHKYYLGNLNKKTYDDNKYQKTEVSDMKWLSLEECLKHIRPYNKERIKIINNVDKILHKYSLIS